MEIEQARWGRTAAVTVALAAVVLAPLVLVTSTNGSWGLEDLRQRLPWSEPPHALAGDLTTDLAAEAACATVPTFSVDATRDGARLSYGGALSLEQANARFEELGVPLVLGVSPQPGARPLTAVSGSFAGGDPALTLAVEGAIAPTGMLLDPVLLPAGGGAAGLVIACAAPDEAPPTPHPFGAGGELACSGLEDMTPAAAQQWLLDRYDDVRLFHQRGPRSDVVDEVPDDAVLAWVDVVEDLARVGLVRPGDPASEQGWRVPDLGGCD